ALRGEPRKGEAGHWRLGACLQRNRDFFIARRRQIRAPTTRQRLCSGARHCAVIGLLSIGAPMPVLTHFMHMTTWLLSVQVGAWLLPGCFSSQPGQPLAKLPPVQVQALLDATPTNGAALTL